MCTLRHGHSDISSLAFHATVQALSQDQKVHLNQIGLHPRRPRRYGSRATEIAQRPFHCDNGVSTLFQRFWTSAMST
jgi:hypothetical protein